MKRKADRRRESKHPRQASFPRNIILSQCFTAGREILPQGYSVDSKRIASRKASEGGTKRGRRKRKNEAGRRGGKGGGGTVA